MEQLGQIEYAKEVWAMDNHKIVSDVAVMDDLSPVYLKTRPACPAGGAYDIHDMMTTPTCSIGGEHKIR